MQYLLIISHDEHFAPTEQLFEDIAAWNAAMERRGAFVYGNPLRPPCDARTIRVREGKTVVTDGPFADSKEKMCSYVLLDCSSMDEATAAAVQHPMASAATIEVRPVWNELNALD